VNDAERSRFERFGTTNVFVAGHAIDPRPTSAPFDCRRSILFVGAFSAQSPNEDAVSFFCTDVLPLLRASGCGAPLAVVGANLPERLQSIARDDSLVSWHADIDDTLPFYQDARVFIAPTRYSAGISLKVIEAAAHGVPVVCTPAVARQLGWTPGEELLAADTAEEFAAAVASLFADGALWERIRESALARVRRDYSVARFRATVHDALSRALTSPSRSIERSGVHGSPA
jgi:glycosyltransferase involved in cell wall biosynthesis